MAAQSKCPNHPTTAHDFFKFDDATIVCHRCGEQRVVDVAALIAKIPAPIYLPCPGPHYPPNVPQWWYPNITTGGTTWSPPAGTTVTYGHDNASYGPENVS